MTERDLKYQESRLEIIMGRSLFQHLNLIYTRIKINQGKISQERKR